MVDDPGEWAAPVPQDRGDRLRVVALPVLLAAIAVVGVLRVAALDQSSWQGASFGMFATYDNTISRSLAVTVTGPDGTARVLLPADLRDDARRLKVVPTEAGADRLAAQVLARIADAEAVEVVVQRLSIEQPPADDGLRISVEEIVSGTARR